MASAYLTRTPSGAGTNSKIFTLSVWIKRCGLGADQAIMGTGTSSGYSSVFLEFNSSDKLRFAQINAQGASPAFEFEYVTNRVFRDTNGFYHIVCTVDSTDSTEADRVKIYVNGVRETSFSTTNHAGSNSTFLWNDARVHSIGRHGEWSVRYQNGVMSHIHNIDGTAYTPSTFGETDATTGIWKAKTTPSVTYGNNGFFLKMDNSGNMGLDSSGNSNNLTTNGTIIQNKDTPSNVFCTMNPLDNYWQAASLSNTNSTTTTVAAKWTPIKSTLGVSKGKYYWEIKHSAVSSGSSYATIGISSTQATGTQQRGGVNANDYSYWYNGELRTGDSAVTTGVGTYGVGDIIGVALDLDNNKLYFSKNGTFVNSGDPTSGATGTGAMSITAPASTSLGAYFADAGFYDNSNTGTFQANFGNGYFGTTAVSSAQNPDDGIGIFEYDVPAGYRALCTKSINAQEYS